MNIPDCFPLGLTSLISLQFKGPSRVFSSTMVFEGVNCLVLSLLYGPAVTSIHDYWKNYTLTIWTSVRNVMFLLFKSLSRFVIVSNKEQISFHFMTAVTVCSDLEPKKKNSIAISIFSHSIYHEVMGLNAVILVFWMLSFKPALSLSSFTLIKRLLFVFCH